MNPETGRLHKLATDEEMKLAMAVSEKDRRKIQHKIKKQQRVERNNKFQQQLMERVEITKKALAERWPIFHVGQVLHLENHDFKVVKINEAKGVISIQSVKYEKVN